MQRENDRRHLLLLVFQKDARLLVHARGGKPHLGDDLVRCGGHEPPHEGQRVDADIQQRTAREIAVEEAVGHIIGLVTAKIHLDKPQLAQRAGVELFLQFAVDGHMVEGHCLGQHDMVLLGQADGLVQLVRVQGDGFLAQNVLTRGQCLAQVLDVGVVRSGNIDDIHVRVSEHIVDLVVDFFNAVLLGEGLGFGMGAVGDGIQRLPAAGQRLRQLIGDNAAAQGGPTVVLHKQNLLSRFCQQYSAVAGKCPSAPKRKSRPAYTGRREVGLQWGCLAQQLAEQHGGAGAIARYSTAARPRFWASSR